jgi:hypothetical protein
MTSVASKVDYSVTVIAITTRSITRTNRSITRSIQVDHQVAASRLIDRVILKFIGEDCR